MHLMKNHAQVGQSERGILHLAPERSQWHSQQSSHLEEETRRGSGCADIFLDFFLGFLDLIYTFTIISSCLKSLILNCHVNHASDFKDHKQLAQRSHETEPQYLHHGGHTAWAPSDHDCKAEDLSLELFRCSAANQRGETRRQDTEGHASEINDEHMAMVNAC